MCTVERCVFAANERGVNLLTQDVPAIYVRLQDVVQQLAAERKSKHKDPVLHADQYKYVQCGCEMAS